LKRSIIAVSCLLVSLTACQTSSEPEVSAAGEFVAPVQFFPATYVAGINAGPGGSPTLFSRQSHALWVGPEVAEEKLNLTREAGDEVYDTLLVDAANLTQHYLIVELHLESAFADSSMAYDSVGLRNIQPILITPDGKRIEPLQQVFASPADESLEGALKVFSRSIILVFPTRNLWLNTPLIEADAPVIQLALEGRDSTHYFEWASAAGPVPPASDPLLRQWVNKINFNELFQRVRRMAHVFD
jgi:hypothetical protein